MKQWVNMLCAVLLLFIAGSTKASSLPFMPSHTVPQQQVMLTASPSHAAQLPEVLEADRVTGEDCFIVRCAIAEPKDLERVVDALAVHGSVTTSLVLSSPVRKTATVLATRRA